MIFYLNGNCNSYDEKWVDIQKSDEFWRKYGVLYNGSRSDYTEPWATTKTFRLTPQDKVAAFRVEKSKNLRPNWPHDNVEL